MKPLDLIKLTSLMETTRGNPGIRIGLIDGPVAMNHPDLAAANVREIPGNLAGICAHAGGTACVHGTFVAGILCAGTDSQAPAICPGCTLLVRPIFADATPANGRMPSATPGELAMAIVDCINAGAHVINLSASLDAPSTRGQKDLDEALGLAARRDVLVVAAAGNQGTLGGSAITGHPWVLPVVACDLAGKTMKQSNLGVSIGRRGLSAPGDNITSLGANGTPLIFGGTSAAAPFVTGTIALLWSEAPGATATEVKLAISQDCTRRRNTVVPPLMDAWAAYHFMESSIGRGD